MTQTITPGCRQLTVAVPAAAHDAPLPVWVLYPAHEEPRDHAFGPYSMSVALNAPVRGTECPVVLISHGNNGTPLTHRDTALHLARAGYVVVLPEHLGNSRSDSTLAGTTMMLERRPQQVRAVLDALFADEFFAPHLDAARVAMIGHSIGAYTALAVAGGAPSTTRFDVPVGPARPVPVTADARIRALVLLAPAAAWFTVNNSLEQVRMPIFMRTGTLDFVTPAMHADWIVRGATNAALVEHEAVPGAGHFSFQSPFPAAMVSPGFPPSQDPPGFDRPAYNAILNDEIERFLRRTLA